MSIYGPWRKYYEKAFERLRASQGAIMEEYVQYLKSKGVKHRRLLKIVTTLNSWANFLSVRFVKATEQDMEKARATLLGSEYSEWTKHDFCVILGGFYKWRGRKKSRYRLDPELFRYKKNLRLNPPNNNPPEDEDIEIMLKTATHTRDRFVLLVLYYTGMRVGELLSLRIKDIEYLKKKKAYKIHIPQGKTGPRSIMAFSQLDNIIKEYLEWHPHKHDSEHFLVVKIAPYTQIGKPANYAGIRKSLNTLAQHSGVIRKTNPHRFRHACNRNLERVGWSEIQRCKYLGWVPGSDMPKVYSHLEVEETDELVLKVRANNEEETARKREAVKEWIRENPEFEVLILQKIKKEIKKAQKKKAVKP